MTEEIQKASTVALCKITTQWPFKILVLKRSEKAQFLPGAYVFPGGRLDHLDQHVGTFLAQDEHNTKRINTYFPRPYDEVLTYLACALRECYEETGISWLKIKSSANSIHYDVETLNKLLRGESPHETCLLDNIFPISWWITPQGETRRYDTWFFLGLVSDETACTINSEVTDARWLYPQDALLAYDAQEIFLAPPTRTILERMAHSKSLKEFLSYVDQPLFPIKPLFITENNQKILILPGDTLHPEAHKSRLPLYTRYSFGK